MINLKKNFIGKVPAPPPSPLLGRPVPAPYFHPLYLSFQTPFPPGEVIKIYSLPFKKGGGVQTTPSHG